MKFIGIIRTTRIFTSLIIASIVILPVLRSPYGVDNSLLLAINLFLTSLGGFALNDYFDYKKDLINKPHRAIPSKKLTPKETLWISIVLLILSFFISLYNVSNNIISLMQIGFLIAMVLYNYIVRVYGIVKTIYTSTFSALIVVYTIFINHLHHSYLLIPLGTFFFILGREILMDVLDIKGDKKHKISTMPIRWGIRISNVFAFTSLLIGVCIIFPLLNTPVTIVEYFRLLLMILTIIICSGLWFLGSNELKRRVILFLWIPMILGLSILI